MTLVWKATAPIYYPDRLRGQLAYKEGDVIPDANVAAYGYDTAGLAAQVTAPTPVPGTAGQAHVTIDQLNAAASLQAHVGLDALQNGVVADGVTDVTAALQTAQTLAAAFGADLFLPAGTYIVDGLTGTSSVALRGAGKGRTIIKRKASATANSVLSYTSKTGFQVCDITIDGNKASQSVGASCLVLTTSSDWLVERVEAINAKAASGFGAGIVVQDGTNDTTVEKGTIRGCRVVANDGTGIYINKDFYINVESNICKGNGGSGISVANFVFPPVADTQDWITIANNHCHDNAGAGIEVLGFWESGATQAAGVYGPTVPPSRAVVITGNHCARNATYGIAFQGAGGAVVGNTLRRNGTTASHGGAVFNAYASTFANNVCQDNAYYGVDAGGSRHCSIVGNQFQLNGVTSGLGCTDISIGAAQYCNVTGNNVQQGGSVASTGISCPGVDGASATDPFPFVATSNAIVANTIYTNGQANSIGISLSRNASRSFVQGNLVTNAPANRAFLFVVSEVVQLGNFDITNGGSVAQVTAAGTLVIPDSGEHFYVNGTTGITSIQTASFNAFLNKVRDVTITNGGSGYTQASPPTVTFTGGGGTGAAATARVSRAGQVIGVTMTNFGTGYTSAPTVGFSSGAAAGTALIGCPNNDGRVITLHFLGALTVTDGSNLLLAGNLTTTATNNILTLRGAFGNWYEMARSAL